jgi:hypothetical protein
MTSQVVFTTNSVLKKEALKKVKQEGITLKAFLAACLKDYVEGKLQFGLRYPNSESEVEIIEVDTKTQKKIDKIGKLIEEKC